MRAILTYHSIDGSGSPISVTPETFRRHVRWLAESSVAVVDLERLLAMSPEQDAVAVTFDDGFENFAEEAWPPLREHGLPVTLFIPVDRVGGHNDWGGPGPAVPRLPLLDWDALGTLRAEGVTIGSHTRGHVDLRGLATDRLEDEVAGAAEELHRRLGARPDAFAYPFGTWDGAARDAVGREHRVACTTRLAPVTRKSDPLTLPRLDAFYFQRDGRLASWGRPSFRLRIRMRRAARSARRWLMPARATAPDHAQSGTTLPAGS